MPSLPHHTLQAGADIIQDSHDNTALHKLMGGCLEAKEFAELLELKVVPILNALNNQGQTPADAAHSCCVSKPIYARRWRSIEKARDRQECLTAEDTLRL
jgi:hypothetical protein